MEIMVSATSAFSVRACVPRMLPINGIVIGKSSIVISTLISLGVQARPRPTAMSQSTPEIRTAMSLSLSVLRSTGESEDDLMRSRIWVQNVGKAAP